MYERIVHERLSLTWTNLQLLLCDFCEILSQRIFVLLIPSTFLTNKNIISLLTFWAKQTIVEHNMYIIHAKACRKIFNPFRIYVILLFPTEKQWYQCSESSWKIAQNACHLRVPSGWCNKSDSTDSVSSRYPNTEMKILKIVENRTKSMLIKTGYPNLFHGCDFLCFNLMNY